MSVATKNRVATAIGPEPTNGGDVDIQSSIPYTVSVTVEGTAPILFHRWNVEEVEEKAKAAKGSKAKKTDNVESYVYRNEKNEICVPGEYLRGAIIAASKFMQDPRSPRKSAADLYKAGVISMTPLASIGKESWDYLDKRRVTVQRNGITRSRPAFNEGWTCTIELMVMLPEYIPASVLNQVVSMAGRLIGLGDFRPTYGRFVVTKFAVISARVA